jgi:hypothetical protein
VPPRASDTGTPPPGIPGEGGHGWAGRAVRGCSELGLAWGLGLRLEDLAEAAEGLHGRGLVSRFTTTPPHMVVYYVGAFKRAIVEEIEKLYSQAVRP